MSSILIPESHPIKLLYDYIKSMWPVIPTELLEFYMMEKKDDVLFQEPKDFEHMAGDNMVWLSRSSSKPYKQTTDNQYVYYKDQIVVSYACRYYPEPDRIKIKWHTRSFLEKILRICDLSDKGIEFTYLEGMIEDSNVTETRLAYKQQNVSQLKIFVGMEYTLFKERVV